MDIEGFNKLYILDMPVDYLTIDEAVDIISKRIQSKKTMVFTSDVDHLVKAQFDVAFKRIYSRYSL